jgi:amino acid transporter
MPTISQPQQAQPGLKRVLGLQALVLYGIVLIQPTAPMPLYGVVCQQAKGHVVTTILSGMIAMLFTAISYGRMAQAYPSAGSAYTYVGRELHPSLGYLTGWAMIFDYILNPIICVIWCSKAALNFLPQVPYGFWIVCFALLFTGLNLRGIEASARTNQYLAIGLGIVIVLFFAAAAHYLWLGHTLSPQSLIRPFYDPATFSWPAVSTATSVAVLTYIGFDGISTLSEEAHNPRRNILLATVLTCVVTGFLAASQVYAAQLVWPTYNDLPDVDTAFVHVAGRAGGRILFAIVNFSLLVATIGSGTGAHLAAGRLLYGMGRDNAIPTRFFGTVDPRTRIPRNNIILVGALALLGACLVSFELGAELLNFGALVGFMGVNLSALVHYFVRAPRKSLWNLVLPLLGFVVCAYIWWSLRTPAKIAGFVWLITGVVYGAWHTKGFTTQIQFAAPVEEAPLLTANSKANVPK